jgi:hypothetical protein
VGICVVAREGIDCKRRLRQIPIGVFAVLAIVSSLGCHVVRQHTLHTPPESVGSSVLIGGEFARATELEIPIGGLTLAEAVEKTIRPGVLDRQRSIMQRSIRPIANPFPDDMPSNEATEFRPSISVAEAADKISRAFIASRSWATFETAAISVIDSLPVETNRGNRQRLGEAMLLAMSDSTIRSMDPDELSLRLARDLSAALAKLNDSESSGFAPDFSFGFVRGAELGKERVEELGKERVEELDSRASSFGETPSRSSPGMSSPGMSSQESRRGAVPADQIVMVWLRRNGGIDKYMELSMVRSTPVGDAALIDNDRILVVPLSSTELASQDVRLRVANAEAMEVQKTSVLLVGLDRPRSIVSDRISLQTVSNALTESPRSSLQDVMVVRSARLGLDEYWFPAGKPAGISLQTGDVVELRSPARFSRLSRLRGTDRRSELPSGLGSRLGRWLP